MPVPTHVLFVQAVSGPHAPEKLHVCCFVRLVQCVWLGAHSPVHVPVPVPDPTGTEVVHE